MNRLCALVLAVVSLAFQAGSQIKLQEGFESGISHPAGGGVWNAAAHPIFSDRNWTVRSAGDPLPGIAVNTAIAYAGTNAIGVGWQAGLDTSGSQPSQADVWVITRRVLNIQSGDVLRFWATGGSQYADSIQISVSTADSTPATQSVHLGTLLWPVGATYGQFNEYTFDLSGFAGQNVWIGFRYYLNASTTGYYVHLDDVRVEPFSSVETISNTMPDQFGLLQNYPNPFNPTTNIGFRIAQPGFVSLTVYNALGREVQTLIHGNMDAGEYRVPFDASGLASGVYFYTLRAGAFSQSHKMVLAR